MFNIYLIFFRTEFYKNQKNGLIVVKERDNEQLEYALTHNSEIRG